MGILELDNVSQSFGTGTDATHVLKDITLEVAEGEFLVLLGTSDRSFVMVILAMGGIVLAASYMLWMLQRVALGQPATRTAALLPDLNAREVATLVPLAVVVLCVGVYPGPLMGLIDSSVTQLLEQLTNNGLPTE